MVNKKTRRSNGEGHYFKKSVNGKDYFAWRIRTGFSSTGYSHKVITAVTQKELIEKVKKYKNEKNNLSSINNVKTLSDFITMYLNIVKPSLKQKTYESYEGYCKRYFLKSRLAEMKLTEITTMDIQECINSYIGKLSPVSINDFRRCLHTIFECAYEHKLILMNPVKNARAPRIPHKEIRILTEEEIKKLLSAANSGEYIHTGADTDYNFGEDDSMIYNRHAFFCALCLLWYAGLRRGECWGLSWKNIDFEKSTIRICQNYQPAENGNGYIDDPKTRNSIRTISIPSKMMKILSDWKKEQEEFAEKYEGIFSNKMNLVFTNMFGEGVSYSTISRYWRKLRKATGLENLRTHDIRHNHISWLLGQGVPATEVARRVGDTVETILRVYAHAMPTHDEETARLLDEKLNIF